MDALKLSAFYLLLVCTVSYVVHSRPSFLPPHIPPSPPVPDAYRGLQFLLPGHTFKQDGMMYNVSLQVEGPNSPLALQVWRPKSIAGNFQLWWSVTSYIESRTVLEREGDSIHFHSPSGVPVRKGDVMGLYIPPSPTPLSVVSTGRGDMSLAFYMEDVSYPYCTLALCNISMKPLTAAFSSLKIHMIAQEELDDSSQEEELRLSLNRESHKCMDNPSLLCTHQRSPLLKRSISQQQDNSSSEGTSAPMEMTTVPNNAITTTETTPPLLPPNHNPNSTNSSSRSNSTSSTLQSTSDGNSVSLGESTNSLSTAVTTATTTSNTGFSDPSSLSGAAIGFIVAGIFFLLILVVLLIILFVCLCSKSPVKNSFVPAATQDLQNSSNSNLVSSSSVEQSNSPNKPSTPDGHSHHHHSHSHRHPSKSPSVNHAYANAEVSLNGDFQPFTPHYVNSDDESMRELLSERGSHYGSKSRDMRAWSVGSSHGDRVYTNGKKQRPRRGDRAKSVSAISRYKIDHDVPPSLPRHRSYTNNLSSVLSKPLPLPPVSVPPPVDRLQKLAQSNPQLPRHIPPPTHRPPGPPPPKTKSESNLAVPRRPFSDTLSDDYTAPIPISERYKYDPKIKQNEAMEIGSIHQQPFFTDRSHDYSDPDEPDHDIRPVAVNKYDHLPPLGTDIHPESFRQILSELEGLKGDGHVSTTVYQYVPTEEQRRMIQLHNGGHYEIEDDLDGSQMIGYDHLNYFKESETYWAPAATAEDLYTQLSENKYREIYREEVSILNLIGYGHFGTVSRGVWSDGNCPVNVAIKTVKNTTEEERVKLLQEAAIMGQFAHENVVRLHGVVTVGEPVLVILEYMQKGDLRSFLQKLHPRVSKRLLPEVSSRLFVQFSKDIANGMSYLAKKCFIHRDLAARNILLNDELTCKIGDFGMARDIESESDYYKSHGGMIPVKWTAPEALHYNKYSSASDVWSYGMVLFEIWALGEKPFSDLSNPIVIALVSSKHCQPPPPGCPRPIYHLMVECWNPDQIHRPTFDSIYDYLDSPEESLLQWQEQDIIHDKMAHKLGYPLEEANNLYLDLQRTYQKPLI